MKVLFISPIVSRRYTNNWDHVCQGLVWTISSLARQTNPDWKIMVVGSEMPKLPSGLDRHVIFTKADIDIDRPESRGRREIDKERKLYTGFVEARSHMPEFVMPLDYDDLVSVRLVEHVSQHPELDAFILKSGYIYHDGNDFCQYSKKIYMRTGSNLVVRFIDNLFPTQQSDFDPPPPEYLKWPFVKSHVKHLHQHFQSLELKYAEVPFPCVIWRRNKLSVSNAYTPPSTSSQTGRPSPWKRLVHSANEFAKKLFLRRPLHPGICQEFGCNYGHGLGTPS